MQPVQVTARLHAAGGAQRDIHVRVTHGGEVKMLRQYSDDGPGRAVERHGPAEDVAPATVVALPESVGQNHVRRCGREVFAGLIYASDDRGNAKRLEEVITDSAGWDHLRPIRFSQDGIAAAAVGCQR